jgi:flagellar FliL protein
MSAATSAAEADGAGAQPSKGKMGKGKLLLIAGVAVVLAGAGGGFWFWQSRSATAEPDQASREPLAPLQFHAVDPAFVVNFPSAQGARFLQVEVRIGSRDAETIALLKSNDPVIRNDLLLLFGAQDQATLATREGKEKLRADTLEAVRRIVRAEGGKPEAAEAVFFTSFVMQ